MANYWIDDDGYIARGEGDEYETVGGPIDSPHIQPLSLILDSHDELLAACKFARSTIYESINKRKANLSNAWHELENAITQAEPNKQTVKGA